MLRRMNMFILWVDVSILLDIIISLMPSLVQLPPPPKHTFYHEFSAYSKICYLVLDMPQIPLYMDLRKNHSCDTGSLESTCIIFKNSCDQSMLMNPLVFVIKCLLLSLLFSSLLQTLCQFCS